VFYFFFSSRRRHTRSKRDWSSDVCSSDLSALKNFIDDQSQPVLAAKRIQRTAFRIRDIGSGGIIGMHHDYSARTFVDSSLKGVQINLPAVIVDQRIRPQLHVLQTG